MDQTTWRRNWPVLLTACFALVWIVHRAAVQSITIDEANTFISWVAPNTPEHWTPNSNNHVLNSMLMRLSVALFGLSDLTVRLPALLGAVVYLFAVYRFCTLLRGELALTWSLFVCFVFNPFVLDYLVAARGYGLALGFLSLAIYLFARILLRSEPTGDRDIQDHAIAISVCVGLSFSANFSFAYAEAFLVLAFFGWACLEQRKRGLMHYARLALASGLPALIVVVVLTGSVLLDFPREHLAWGTNSVTEAWLEVRRPSYAEFNEFNAAFVSPLFDQILRAIRPYIQGCLAVFLSLYVVLLLMAWPGRDRDERSNGRLAACLAATLFLTLLAHWLQFKLFKILLPLERTALFAVPLATAFAGAVFSVPPSHLAERVVRTLGIAILCVTGIYFFAALRDSYFNEWRAGADVKAAFPVVLDVCRRAGIREVATEPGYAAGLNFYRAVYSANDLLEFRDNLDQMPPGKPIYVVSEKQYGDFIRTEGLEIVYHGPGTDLVIAVRPR